jgi:hypothetical protein
MEESIFLITKTIQVVCVVIMIVACSTSGDHSDESRFTQLDLVQKYAVTSWIYCLLMCLSLIKSNP